MARTIQICGAGHRNKGALLMLATVVRMLRQRDPGVRLTLPMREIPYGIRAHYGLHLTLPAGPSFMLPRAALKDTFACIGGRLIKRSWHDRLGVIAPAEVDVNLDISGYAFGDKWPRQRTTALTAMAAKLGRRGGATVMLPQTLGPFKRPEMAAAFRQLSEHVQMICAREPESFDYAKAHTAHPDRLRLYPDITIAMPASVADNSSPPYACIVPNSKLLEPNPQQQDWGEQYVRLLGMAAKHLLQRGLAVRIVLHEHEGADVAVAQQVHDEVASDQCTVVTDWDPCVLKGILAGAQVVIGSRFHSLVSALSSGVPSIAMGWSHKYDSLMQQFGTPDQLHFASQPAEHLIELLQNTLDNRSALADQLLVARTKLAASGQKMWDEVFQVIGMHEIRPA